MNKICFFLGSINKVGGTERVALTIANSLAKDGYDVSILALKGDLSPCFEVDYRIKLDTLNMSSIGFRYFSKVSLDIRKYVIKNQISNLICVESILSLYVIPVLYPKVKCICWEHFNFTVSLGLKTRIIARYYAALFFDNIVTLTDADKELWSNKTFGKAKVDCINNPSPFQVSSQSPRLENKKFLAVGRLSHQKGYDKLLRSWSMCNSRFNGWTLSIVGEGEDRSSLEKIIRDLSLSDSVKLEGSSNDIRKFYESATYFIMSSRFEGLPMVLLEAQSFGLPILSVDCLTGPREIVENEINGFLCGHNTLSDQIDKVTKNISDCGYVDLTMNSKKKIEVFSLNVVIPKWKALLNG